MGLPPVRAAQLAGPTGVLEDFMKTFDTKAAALLALALAAPLPAAAQTGGADTWRQSTQVRFDQPVEIPGRVLPPGTYVFKLINSDTSKQTTVQIFNGNDTQPVATALTTQIQRTEPTDRTYFIFVDPSSQTGSGMSGTGSSGSGSTYGSGGTGSTSGSGSSGSDMSGSSGSGNTGSMSGSGNTGSMSGSGSAGSTGSGSMSGSGSSGGSYGTGATTSGSSVSASRPLILKAWFYPGKEYGQEFVYGQDRASLISGGQERYMEVGTDSRLSRMNATGTSGTGSTGSYGTGSGTSGNSSGSQPDTTGSGTSKDR
jgi:hypothetical protein